MLSPTSRGIRKRTQIQQPHMKELALCTWLLFILAVTGALASNFHSRVLNLKPENEVTDKTQWLTGQLTLRRINAHGCQTPPLRGPALHQIPIGSKIKRPLCAFLAAGGALRGHCTARCEIYHVCKSATQWPLDPCAPSSTFVSLRAPRRNKNRTDIGDMAEFQSLTNSKSGGCLFATSQTASTIPLSNRQLKKRLAWVQFLCSQAP